jgi:hypothetical protein
MGASVGDADAVVSAVDVLVGNDYGFFGGRDGGLHQEN